MAINLGMGFKVGNMEPIDARFVMSKAEMLAVTPATQPDIYFCVCSDDSLMYVYDSSNSEDVSTGKFRCVSTGAVDMGEYQKIIDDTLTTMDKTVPGAINELLTLINDRLTKPEIDGVENDVLTIDTDGNAVWKAIPEVDLSGKLDKPGVEGVAGQILVLQDDGNLAYQDNVTEFDDTELRELIDTKISKPEVEGTVGQILVLQDDGSLAYQDNVTEFDDTAIQEELDNKLSKPEIDGVSGQILVLQDDGSLAYQDNVTEYDDTELRELIDTKLSKPEVDGVVGQILILQDDGSLAYQDNVTEFDDTEIRELIDTKISKPEVEGTVGQILILQDDGSLAYQDNVTEYDDTAIQEAVANKLNKPVVDGTAGQILVLQDDGSLAYQDNVTEFDDTEIQEELDNKLSKPEIEGSAGQILVLQDDGSLAYQDNVSEFDDTELQEELDTKLDKEKVVQNLDTPDTESVLSTEALNTVLNNKLDKVEGSSLVPDTEIAKIHDHINQDVLDKLSDDGNGKLLYDSNPISVDVPIATVDVVGTVKPDGTTITITDDGTITAVGVGAAGGDVADFVSNTVVGAIPKNTNLNGKTSMEILKMALVSYVDPTANVSYSQPNTVLKRGQSFDLTITVSGINKGTSDVAELILIKDGTVLETIPYVTGTNSYEFSPITGINTNCSFQIKVADTQGKQYSTTKSYSFVDPYYIGATDGIPTADTVVTLTELIEAKSNKTKKVTAADQYVVYAYPASYGNLTSIIDGNGFENLTDYTKISLTINDVAYNCYHTTGKKSMTDFSYTYKH